MALQIDDLRKLCTNDTIIMTAHVIKRCKERNIDSDSIISVIMHGEIIKQYEDDKPFPSCLLMGKDENGQVLHAVISHDGEYLHLITAYYPNRDLWEADLQTRKGRS